ncbi:MAG: hypothetical protein EON55_12455 [Alphaproteobacteria bacterium]|nr:MAG: hypothetical protein EON55_12455 [Alphaproteobacteria bacterium]
MNTRVAFIVAAIVFTASASASAVLAQSDTAPAGITADVASGGHGARGYDDITTGSIGYGRQPSSAQEGNAEQNSFPVWQYGRTSGGTAR